MFRGSSLQRRRIALVILIFAVLPILSTLIAGCSEQQGEKENVVIWDVAHKPVFSPKSFSRFISVLESSGLAVVQGKTADTSTADAYIIAGPTEPFEEKEVVQIKRFVKRGGKLVIMIHIPPSNLKLLLDALDIRVSQKPLEKMEVSATPAYSHVLTEGIDKIVLYGCFQVSDPIFKANSVGVAGYRKYGRGEILVIGDDALFINEYIHSGDNLDFARNIARWLSLRNV